MCDTITGNPVTESPVCQGAFEVGKACLTQRPK